MAPRPRCAVCGSKRWRQGAGGIQCEEGHLLLGYVQESNESQDASKHVTQTRRMRVNKVRKVKDTYNPNGHFHGARAEFLKWQCLQWLLRTQIKVLIDDLGYPHDLEVVAKDLWTMLLVSSGVSDGPGEFYRDEEGPESFSGTKEGAIYQKKRKVEEDEEEDESEDEEERARREEAEFSSDEEDEEPAPSKPDVTTPLRSTSVKKRKLADAASESTDPYVLKKAPKRPNQPVKTKDPRTRVRMDFTLSIIYLSCVTLRLPVFLSDIVRLAETQKIPFLHAQYSLPLEMSQHLNRFDRAFFNHISVSRTNDATGMGLGLPRLVAMYKEDWSVEFPEANVPLLSWRICKALGCSPLFYTSLRTLLALLPSLSLLVPIAHFDRTQNFVELSPTPPLAPFSDILPSNNKESDMLQAVEKASTRLRSGTLPENIIVSAVVVLAKLIYGSTAASLTLEQGPLDDFDVLNCLPSLGEWIVTMKALALVKEEHIPEKKEWEKDVASLDEDEIDRYLEFCETHLARNDHLDKAAEEEMQDLDRHFPAPYTPTPFHPSTTGVSSITRQVEELTQTLHHTRPSPPESRGDAPAADSRCRVYHSLDPRNLEVPSAVDSLLIETICSVLDLSLANPLDLLKYVNSIEASLASRASTATKRLVAKEESDARTARRALAMEVFEYETRARIERRVALDEMRREIKRRDQARGVAGGVKEGDDEEAAVESGAEEEEQEDSEGARLPNFAQFLAS